VRARDPFAEPLDGVRAITASVRAVRQEERWGYLMLEGVVAIVTAAIALLWPGITVLAFVFLVAGWALVTGVLMIAAAFRLDSVDGRWWLVLGGIVSLLYGGALAAAPLGGAVVLTWWLGAYALVFGVALLVAGFKLRSAGLTPASSKQRLRQADRRQTSHSRHLRRLSDVHSWSA
jgi:uncharacterized membrane protein HdeD (DUF308 family)